MAANTTAATATAAAPPPARRPPRPVPARRLRYTADRNRPLEILSVLVLYVAVVHYALKFAAFFLPEVAPSREELLDARGAAGVLGFSSGAPPLPSRGSEKGRFDWGGAAPKKDGSTPSLSERENRGGGVSSSSHRRGWSFSAIATLRSFSESLREDVLVERIDGEFVSNGIIGTDVKRSGNSTNDGDESMQAAESPEQKRHRRPRIPILSYEDEYVIVSKPAGMTMHRNSDTGWGRSKSPVLQTLVRRQLCRKPYLVHRLDHRTSGAAIMGFDSRTAGELHGRLRGRDAVKLYVALARGDLRDRFRLAAAATAAPDCAGDDGVASASVVESRRRAPEIRIGGGGEAPPPPRHRGSSRSDEHEGRISVRLPIKVDGVEKEARTDFYFLASMEAPGGTQEKEEASADRHNADDDAAATKTAMADATPRVTKSLTLLLCRPRTGRTHQIRRHLQRGLRSPVVGDSEHGDSRVNRCWREAAGLDRLGLHCWYLDLPPHTGESGDSGDGGVIGGSIRCIAPLTPDFSDALRHDTLRPLWEEATRVEPRLEMEPYDERGGTFGRHYRTKVCGRGVTKEDKDAREK